MRIVTKTVSLASLVIAAISLEFWASGQTMNPKAAPATTVAPSSDRPSAPGFTRSTVDASTTRPSPHDGDRFRLPHVIDLVQSPDGRYLAAAYFVSAMNRPGTDWDAWVAVWNLKTGRRTIIPNATAPLAISPDGQWLAMGLYERSRDPQWRMELRSGPALWRVGEVEFARKLACDLDPNTLLAWTFSSNGKEVMAIGEDCCVLAWEVSGEAPARKIATLTLPGIKLLGRYAPGNWKANLHTVKNNLLLLAPVKQEQPSAEGAYAVRAGWTEVKANWSQFNLEIFKEERPLTSDSTFRYEMFFDGKPYELSLPAKSTLPYVGQIRPSSMFRWANRFAFAPKEHLVAFMDPDASLATVRKINGGRLAQFPAAVVHAFTPDGTQLIVSDCRGVLRFWDVCMGRIVRTLRLDDRPPNTFLVAAIQAASEFGQPEHNRKKLERTVAEAAQRGAQVVVLPETAVTGYMSEDIKQTWRVDDRPLAAGLTGIDPKDAAEPVPGTSTRFFSGLARQWGIYLTIPLLEVDRKTKRHYNTIVLIGPDGGTLIHYRKLNPWPWAEQGWASEGNLGRPVVDTPFGRLGVLICFDIHKQAEELAKLKIDTLLYSIAWVDDKDSDWFPKRLPEIARTHGYNIVAANWAIPARHPQPSWHGYGQSTVIDATGGVLAKAAHAIGENIILADLPLPTVDGASKE